MNVLRRAFPTQALLESLRIGVTPEDTQREDRVIAVARCILAGVSLLAIFLDPTEPSRYAALAYSLLIVYVMYSAVVLAAARSSVGFSRKIRFSLHSVDILWVAVITWFTTGPNSPFFVFSLFVLLAAAYRWGFRETLLTAVCVALIPVLQALLFESGTFRTLPAVSVGFELNRLIMRVTWLILMGVLLGFMAEAERLHRAETALVAKLLARVQAARGMRHALQDVLSELMRICAADRAHLLLREERSARGFQWEICRSDNMNPLWLKLSELEPTAADSCFEETAAALYLPFPPEGNCSQVHAISFSAEGRRLGRGRISLPAACRSATPWTSLLFFAFKVKPEWSARLVFYDVQWGGSPDEHVRFLQKVLREIGPALQSLYLLRRLRWRAGVVERARVARELHDGAIQSLIALEMEVEVLRRQMDGQSPAHSESLARMQKQLHQEILNLRELIEQVKPIDVGPRELVEHLASTVNRFQRDTGIPVTFVCPFEELPLSPHVARETSRILQEALVNIRKHSRARHVVVRLTLESTRLLLVIDDDGCGFPFSGRFAQQELDMLRKGPLVIKERVRSLGGDLVIESNPDRGARLEISIPR